MRTTPGTLRTSARCLSGCGQLADTDDGLTWAQVDRAAEKHPHPTVVTTAPAQEA